MILIGTNLILHYKYVPYTLILIFWCKHTVEICLQMDKK